MKYQDFLKQELAKRCAANARYSLRAFARDLDMSPSRISQILNCRLGLSAKGAKKIATKLGLSSDETEHFCQLVELCGPRTQINSQSNEALKQYEQQAESYRQLHMDAFQIISDWHHYALLELLKTKDAQSSTKWIAKKLGISKYEVELAIERLKRVDLLRSYKGELKPTTENFTTSVDQPSEAIRKFHSQILRKALVALETQNVEERDMSAVTAAISSEQIGEYKKMIRKFRREMNALFERRAASSTDVYCLSIQFFKLTEKIN